MPGIDVFNSQAFDTFSLTEAVNKVPYQPGLIGSLGLFEDRPITTTLAAVEDRQGTLALLNTAGRGSTRDIRNQPARTIRDIRVPHIPYYQTILGDDVQNKRAFGSEGGELEGVMSVVADQLQGMRADHEATMEYHRINALQGSVKDGDGTTVLHNYFTIFGITENQIDIDLGTATTDVKGKASAILREIAGALGATPFTQPLALCGDTYFDALTDHTKVKDGYERWQSSLFFRTTQIGPEYGPAMNGFDFGGITWVNYRGAIGGTAFFPANEARIIPRGVPGLYINAIAPGTAVDAVNTPGIPIYASQERLPHNEGIELKTQSNVLPIVTRPAAVIKSVNQ